MNFLFRSWVFIFIICGLAFTAPEIYQVTANQDSIGIYEKFELTVNLSAEFTNPYDFGQINLQATFYSPSEETFTVDGFYFQQFEISGEKAKLTPDSQPVWKIRFAPTEPGVWTYEVNCRDHTGETSHPGRQFICTPGQNPGFIRVATNRFLQFDDATPYFALGLNMGWYGARTILDYQDWMRQLAANGGNFIRVWMCSWAFAIEWKDTGLGDYTKRQNRAFQLDWVLDFARQKGIFVQLCLNNHGQVSTRVNPEWGNNPYNKENGGPCEETRDFFTNERARKLVRQRLRYIVARWGFASQILAWELFNEIDWTDEFAKNREDVLAWHLEMANYLKQLDVNQHLVTTSFAQEMYDPELWKNENIHVTQLHNYLETANLQSVHYHLTQNYAKTYRKPVMIGEFSLSNADWLKENDPDGINLHNTLWASAMSGNFGAAATWWWDSYIDSKDLYPQFKPVSRFLEEVAFVKENFEPFRPVCQSKQSVDLTISPGFSSWGKSPANEFTFQSDGTMIPSTDKLAKYLFGAVWNTEYRNPPTFQVDFTQPRQFSLTTASTTGNNPVIEIWLDDVKMLSGAGYVNTTYSIEVPEGVHSIKVDNSGTDWIEIAEFRISDFVPAVRSFALKGNTEIIGWIQHRGHNWKSIRDTGEPETITDATFSIPDLKPKTLYQIEWWNCQSGQMEARTEEQNDTGTLTVAVPALKWDYAFKITAMETGIKQTEHEIKNFRLDQNYPNPFNTQTNINYTVFGDGGKVFLAIYNVNGKFVRTLVNSQQTGGVYQIIWDGTDDFGRPVPSGIYYYQLRFNAEELQTKRLVLIK